MDFLALSDRLVREGITNKNRAWYIWYFTPVSKVLSWSKESTFFKACAPKAPRMMARAPNIEAVVSIFLSLSFEIQTGLQFKSKVLKFE